MTWCQDEAHKEEFILFAAVSPPICTVHSKLLVMCTLKWTCIKTITMPTSTCYITITHATPSSVSTLVKTKSWVGCVSVALVSTHPAQKGKNITRNTNNPTSAYYVVAMTKHPPCLEAWSEKAPYNPTKY